jgi:DNA adenine methylase
MAAPLLKWPGGKRKLLQHLTRRIPGEYGRYFEPFIGGGALFFAIQPQEAVIADLNCDLIECYTQIRDHPEGIIEYLAGQQGSEEWYYRVRTSVPSDPIELAGRLIYLLTLSFNGIHRTNQKGEFNVPYGHRPHLHPIASSRIRRVSEILQQATLRSGDFAASVADAAAGDVVYLDPPYTVAHGQNGFLRYNARIFSWHDQGRLAEAAHQLAQRGCHVIISNADHPSISDLYPGFRVTRVERHSSIAAGCEYRRLVTECIFYNE